MIKTNPFFDCTTSFHLGQDVVAIARHPLSVSGVMEFGSILGSTDGGVSILCPVPSSSHARLLALQNVMTNLLSHPCGMNPTVYRAK
jgi:hypothetical protein